MTPQPFKKPPLSGRMLALPVAGKVPSFTNIAGIVKMGLLYNQQVCIFCLTEKGLARWLEWVERLPAPPQPELLNANHATLPDWVGYLNRHRFDLVVLSNAWAELQAGRLAVGYLNTLIRAIPAGLVMVA